MDRDLLKAYLDQGLSLEQIGVLESRHPSTIGYWLKKHGLEATGHGKHAPRGSRVPREQLEALIGEGLSLRQIADRLDLSASGLRHWMAKYALSTQQAAINREKPREIRRLCRKHGEAEFVLRSAGYKCKRCNVEAVARRRRKVKAILVEEAGGRCRLCGYDRYVGALHFHHIDPAEKSYGLAVGGITRSIVELRKEAAKCALLCSNCHAEVEGGYATLS